MAYTRLSPGIYRDSATGKTVRSKTNPANAPQQAVKPPPMPQAPPQQQFGQTTDKGMQFNQAAPGQNMQQMANPNAALPSQVTGPDQANQYGTYQQGPMMNVNFQDPQFQQMMQRYQTGGGMQGPNAQSMYGQNIGQGPQQQMQNPLNSLQQNLRSPYSGGY